MIVWSGDNPCSLIGVGLVREGRVAISLGTSDTIFGLMKAPRVDPHGTGHVFGAPTGDFMGLTCFSNGSLARERVRDAYGLSWAEFSRALGETPPGNDGRILLPWFEPEITPPVRTPGVHRFGLDPHDAAGNVRGVVEAQQMALAIHSRWMGISIDTIHATGGAAVNAEILQVMADVFGADVYRSGVSNAAALGAALRAWHADTLADGSPRSWDAITAGLAEPSRDRRIAPDPARHAVYRDLLPVYEACEALSAVASQHGLSAETRPPYNPSGLEVPYDACHAQIGRRFRVGPGSARARRRRRPAAASACIRNSAGRLGRCRAPPTAPGSRRRLGEQQRHAARAAEHSSPTSLACPTRSWPSLERRARTLFGPDAEATFGDALYLTLLANTRPADLGSTGSYSQNWLPDRYFEHRTSLIVDPADGRLPPPTAEGHQNTRQRVRQFGLRRQLGAGHVHCRIAASITASPICSPPT